jgi:hypothetical protein
MRFSLSFVFALPLCMAAPAFSQADSMQPRDTLPSKVLIATASSYLENAVSAIVKDSLRARGYEVTIADNGALAGLDRRRYRAVILFSAVKQSKLTRTASKFMRSQIGPGEESNMLVCNVLGEPWDGADERVSGIASATKRVDPAEIAARVVANFDNVVGRKRAAPEN